MHNTALKSLQEGHRSAGSAHPCQPCKSPHRALAAASRWLAQCRFQASYLAEGVTDQLATNSSNHKQHCTAREALFSTPQTSFTLSQPLRWALSRQPEPSRTGGKAAQLLQAATFSAAAAQQSCMEGRRHAGEDPPAC